MRERVWSMTHGERAGGYGGGCIARGPAQSSLVLGQHRQRQPGAKMDPGEDRIGRKGLSSPAVELDRPGLEFDLTTYHLWNCQQVVDRLSQPQSPHL